MDKPPMPTNGDVAMLFGGLGIAGALIGVGYYGDWQHACLGAGIGLCIVPAIVLILLLIALFAP